MNTKLMLFATALLITTVTAHSQNAVDACARVYQDQISNISNVDDQIQYNNFAYEQLCDTSSKSVKNDWNADLSVVIYSIPIGLKGGSDDEKQQADHFCHTWQYSQSGSQSIRDFVQEVSAVGTRGFNACMALASHNVTLSVHSSPDVVGVQVAPNNGSLLQIDSASAAQLTCNASYANSSGVIKNQAVPDVSKQLAHPFNVSTHSTVSFTCQRMPISVASDGNKEYDDASFVIQISGDSQLLQFPHTKLLGRVDSAAAQAEISELAAELAPYRKPLIDSIKAGKVCYVNFDPIPTSDSREFGIMGDVPYRFHWDATGAADNKGLWIVMGPNGMSTKSTGTLSSSLGGFAPEEHKFPIYKTVLTFKDDGSAVSDKIRGHMFCPVM